LVEKVLLGPKRRFANRPYLHGWAGLLLCALTKPTRRPAKKRKKKTYSQQKKLQNHEIFIFLG